jgi:hypothetical protein
MPSPDGKWLYYTKPGASLWRIPAEGGEEAEILPPGALADPLSIWGARSGVYFQTRPNAGSGGWPVKLYRFADGKTVEVARTPQKMLLNFSVSPDEKWMAWSQIDTATFDLMLVENFR